MPNLNANIVRIGGTAQPQYLRGRHRSVYLAAYQRNAAIAHIVAHDGEVLAA